MSSGLPDTDLIGLVLKGDQQAYAGLVDRYQHFVFTLALKYTGSREDAEEVSQDVFVKAYRSLADFRGGSKFSTWLYRITSNCASTQLGRRARHRHDELDDEVALDELRPDANPEASLDSAVLRSRLQAALLSLPPRLRAVVVLREGADVRFEDLRTFLADSVANFGQRVAVKLDQLVAHLAIEMVVLRIAVVVLVDRARADFDAAQQSGVDELYMRVALGEYVADDLAQLAPARPHAGQVAQRRQRCLGADALRDPDRSVPRRPTGAACRR